MQYCLPSTTAPKPTTIAQPTTTTTVAEPTTAGASTKPATAATSNRWTRWWRQISSCLVLRFVDSVRRVRCCISEIQKASRRERANTPQRILGYVAKHPMPTIGHFICTSPTTWLAICRIFFPPMSQSMAKVAFAAQLSSIHGTKRISSSTLLFFCEANTCASLVTQHYLIKQTCITGTIPGLVKDGAQFSLFMVRAKCFKVGGGYENV